MDGAGAVVGRLVGAAYGRAALAGRCPTVCRPNRLGDTVVSAAEPGRVRAAADGACSIATSRLSRNASSSFITREHTPPSHMRPAASYVAACVLALPALAAAFRPEVLLARPGIAAAPSTARRAASRITLLLDPSLAADASAALVPAAASPGLAPWDAHTLSTLWPDMIHTTIYATVGLMGAYVTQVTPCQRAFPLCSVAHLLRPPSACRAAGRGGLRPADGRRLRRPARAHAPAAPAAALRV